MIWTQDSNGIWIKKLLTTEAFSDVIWRISWSPSGNVLAVSCGENKVTLWKENVEGTYQQIGDVSDNYQ